MPPGVDMRQIPGMSGIDTSQAGFSPYQMPQLNGSNPNTGIVPPNMQGGIQRQTFFGGPLPTNVQDVNFGITPLSPQAMQFRGPDGQMHGGSQTQGGGWAGSAGGGASQGGGVGQGWTGISGDAARGMFGGMAQASSDAIKQDEYAKFRRSNRQ